jgi:hypothetical protein
MNQQTNTERLKVDAANDSWDDVYARVLLLSERIGEEPRSIVAREMTRAAKAEDDSELRLLSAVMNVLLSGRGRTAESWAHEPGPTPEELLEQRREDGVLCYFEVQGRENYPLRSSQFDEPPYDYSGQIVHDFDRGSLAPVRVQVSGLISIETSLDILKHMVTLMEENRYRLEDRSMWVDNVLWASQFDCDWPWHDLKR